MWNASTNVHNVNREWLFYIKWIMVDSPLVAMVTHARDFFLGGTKPAGQQRSKWEISCGKVYCTFFNGREPRVSLSSLSLSENAEPAPNEFCGWGVPEVSCVLPCSAVFHHYIFWENICAAWLTVVDRVSKLSNQGRILTTSEHVYPSWRLSNLLHHQPRWCMIHYWPLPSIIMSTIFKYWSIMNRHINHLRHHIAIKEIMMNHVHC